MYEDRVDLERVDLGLHRQPDKCRERHKPAEMNTLRFMGK